MLFTCICSIYIVFFFSNDRAEQPLNLNNGTCKFPFEIQYNEEVSDTHCHLKKVLLYVNECLNQRFYFTRQQQFVHFVHHRNSSIHVPVDKTSIYHCSKGCFSSISFPCVHEMYVLLLGSPGCDCSRRWNARLASWFVIRSFGCSKPFYCCWSLLIRQSNLFDRDLEQHWNPGWRFVHLL